MATRPIPFKTQPSFQVSIEQALQDFQDGTLDMDTLVLVLDSTSVSECKKKAYKAMKSGQVSESVYLGAKACFDSERDEPKVLTALAITPADPQDTESALGITFNTVTSTVTENTDSESNVPYFRNKQFQAEILKVAGPKILEHIQSQQMCDPCCENAVPKLRFVELSFTSDQYAHRRLYDHLRTHFRRNETGESIMMIDAPPNYAPRVLFFTDGTMWCRNGGVLRLKIAQVLNLFTGTYGLTCAPDGLDEARDGVVEFWNASSPVGQAETMSR